MLLSMKNSSIKGRFEWKRLFRSDVKLDVVQRGNDRRRIRKVTAKGKNRSAVLLRHQECGKGLKRWSLNTKYNHILRLVPRFKYSATAIVSYCRTLPHRVGVNESIEAIQILASMM